MRVGGGPSGIVYGLQMPPQALVSAPRVGLSHAPPGIGQDGRSVPPGGCLPAPQCSRRGGVRPHRTMFFVSDLCSSRKHYPGMYSLDSDFFLLKLHLQERLM